MANDFTAGVYIYGTFATANPTMAQQIQQAAAAQDLASSGMGVGVLASFHVHEDGSIFFNDTLVISGGQPSGQLNPNLPSLLWTMGNAGVALLASFGGGGVKDGHAVGYYDFTNIKNLIAQYPNPSANPFFQNLTALFKTYPAIIGVDVDLETYGSYDPFHDTVVTLIKWLRQDGREVTIAPFDVPDFWVGVLQQTIGPDGKQTVSLVNLQSAGSNLQKFLPALQQGNVGWADVPSHIFAGEQIDPGTSPSQVQEMFYYDGQQQSGLSGGWLWTYENFDGPASGYANAIRQGLGGNDSDNS